MQKKNFLAEKLDVIFKLCAESYFLHVESKESLRYVELEIFIQKIKQFFGTQKIDEQTPILICLPRGEYEVCYVSCLLYLGVPAMVLSDSMKSLDIERIFKKYPFKAMITTTAISQSISSSQNNKVLELVNDEVVLIKNKNWSHSNINFSWLLNTSGSTGPSKAVMLSSDNIAERTKGEIKLFKIKEASQILNILPLSHDLGLNQLLTVLYSGSSIEVFTKKLPVEFALRMQKQKIDGITGMPEIWNNFLQIVMKNNWVISYEGYLSVSGGSMSTERLKQLRGVFSKARIYKTYGQTETFRSLALTNQSEIASDTCGTFIDGVTGYLVDDKNQKCVLQETGELVHFGAGSMSGYWLDTEQTNVKAVPVLSSTNFESQTQFGIRTGDYFKLLPDNQFQYSGRKDDQVKVNGLRFYLSEIENCILGLRGISKACVIKFNDDQEIYFKEKILAFIVSDDRNKISAYEIKTYCIENLERHKVPNVIIFYDNFPMTTTLKVDRQQLLKSYLLDQKKHEAG